MPRITVRMRAEKVAPREESYTFDAWEFRVEPSGAITIVDENGRLMAAFQAAVWETVTTEPGPPSAAADGDIPMKIIG
jgi:hypothetical protein